MGDYFKENAKNLMGIEIGDTVAVYKPYHYEHGNQFIVEKIIPCETSYGKQFDVRGKPINGGWINGFTTPQLTIISKGTAPTNSKEGI